MRQLVLAGILGAVVASGCAKPPVIQPPVFPFEAVAEADALVDRGCYDCLIRAREIYRTLGEGPFRTEILPRLFEAELLVVLRHKELAMSADGPRADVQRTADELPATIEAARYLAIVDAIPEDRAGISQREATAFLRAHREWPARLTAEVAWLAQGPLRPTVRQYLSRSLQCVDGYAGTRKPTPADDRIPEDETPLVTFGIGICARSVSPPRLEVARSLVPEFHEASFFLARDWLNDAVKFGTARSAAALAEIAPRFPESPSVAFAAGSIQQARSECTTALRFYDRTLALRPQHENAMLGHAMCLSHLKRFPEAIAMATTLVAAGGDTLPFAYYWRAWNHHQLVALADARTDIEAAKRTALSVDFLVLAGIIAHDQGDLDPAMIDLRRALTLSRGRSCTASWYIALVHLKRSLWADAATSFEQSMECFAQNVRESRALIASLERDTEIDAGFRAEEIARLRTAIVEDERQRHAAAINAAKNHANSGAFDHAVRLGTVALEDPALADEVAVLRDYLIERKAAVQLPAAPVARTP